MALQIGGQISLSNITGEMGIVNSNVSLGGLSTHSTLNDQSPYKPNESQPHAMSEFFAYDHSYSSLKALVGGPAALTRNKWFDSCGDKADTFYAHNGNKEMPVVGDMLFLNDRGNYVPVKYSHVKIDQNEQISESMIVTTDGEAVIIDINSCEGLEPGDPKEPGFEPDEPGLEPGRR